MLDPRIHGGADRSPCPTPLTHDFSTNRNAAGPAPQAQTAIAHADCSAYPDPHYRELRTLLAAAHRVEPARVLIAASASEAIHRLSLAAHLNGVRIARVPAHAFGDYAHAAASLGWQVLKRPPRSKSTLGLVGHMGQIGHMDWACEPASPLGDAENIWDAWKIENPHAWRILDCAYAPLRLDNLDYSENNSQPSEKIDFQNMLSPAAQYHAAHIWQIWSPNKALGLTGVRGAYVIAPECAQPSHIQRINALAASWVVGTHGAAMLQSWCSPEVQRWLQTSRSQLAQWRTYGQQTCADLGWAIYPTAQANYFCANIFGKKNLQNHSPNAKQNLEAVTHQVAHLLHHLRYEYGIRVRDAQSFGLAPGWLRLGVLPENAWDKLKAATMAYRCRLGGF